MLNRSMPKKNALIHFILISKVKDMKNDVLEAIKEYF
jgi:hypothetical protein